MQDKIKLKQLFANNTDCYADTWQNVDAELHNGCHFLKEGEVIPAMTQDKFVEVVSQLLPTLTDAEIGWVDVNDRLPEFETDVLLFDNWKSRDGEQMKDIRVGYLSEYTKLKSSNGEVVSCEWKGTEFAFNITHWMPLPPTPTA